MRYARQSDTYVLRFEDGEPFPGRFLDFLAAEGVISASLTGIGALRRVRIAFFDIATREYRDAEFDEQMEVLALVGNVALYEDEPLAHIHVTLGRADYSVVGGHLREGVVRPTLEVTLAVNARAGSDGLRRRLDPNCGLPLLDLPNRF